MEENIKEESMEGGQGPKSEASKELRDGKKSPKAELWKYSAVGCKKKKKNNLQRFIYQAHQDIKPSGSTVY